MNKTEHHVRQETIEECAHWAEEAMSNGFVRLSAREVGDAIRRLGSEPPPSPLIHLAHPANAKMYGVLTRCGVFAPGQRVVQEKSSMQVTCPHCLVVMSGGLD